MWKINSTQTLFYFLADSCKIQKQNFYNMILLTLDNTPK